MPDFFAFAGLRYDCNAAGTDLEALAAPPYDVIDEDQRAALEAQDAHNAVRLLLPRDEHARRRSLRPGGRPRSTAWERDGVLVVDPEPRLYSYRMQFRDLARHARATPGA